MESNRQLSKSELESHTRILEQSLDSDKFESIFELGAFNTPSIILKFKTMPTKQYLNMLYNSLKMESDELKKEDDNKVYLYFYLNKNVAEPVCISLGIIEKSLENLYRLEEIVKRFNVDVIEYQQDGTVKELNYLEYITTMVL